MAFVSLTSLLGKALAENYAVGHFNVNNLEFAQAILLAAQEEQSPVILAVSEGYIRYLGGLKTVAAMIRALAEDLEISVPVAIHLDHGSSFEICIQAIHAGFTSVMIDASHYPLVENIAQAKKVVDIAHSLGVSVEAELGRIGGKEDDLVVDEAEAMYAIPEECVELVRDTSVDCLAPALGSVHGPYKGKPVLGFSQMAVIQKLTGVPLVLHGGTGIPDEDIRRAISMGTAKINVNTDNQMACSAAVREFLQGNPNEYDPRTYLGAAREAVKKTVKAKIRLFGSTGKA